MNNKSQIQNLSLLYFLFFLIPTAAFEIDSVQLPLATKRCMWHTKRERQKGKQRERVHSSCLSGVLHEENCTTARARIPSLRGIPFPAFLPAISIPTAWQLHRRACNACPGHDWKMWKKIPAHGKCINPSRAVLPWAFCCLHDREAVYLEMHTSVSFRFTPRRAVWTGFKTLRTEKKELTRSQGVDALFASSSFEPLDEKLNPVVVVEVFGKQKYCSTFCTIKHEYLQIRCKVHGFLQDIIIN